MGFFDDIASQLLVRLVGRGSEKQRFGFGQKLNPLLAFVGRKLHRDLSQLWTEFQAWPRLVQVGYVAYISLFLTVGMWDLSGHTGSRCATGGSGAAFLGIGGMGLRCED